MGRVHGGIIEKDESETLNDRHNVRSILEGVYGCFFSEKRTIFQNFVKKIARDFAKKEG